MTNNRRSQRVLGGMLTALLLSLGAIVNAFADGAPSGQWIATWTTANKVRSPFDGPTPAFNDVTLRQIIRVSAGGTAVRVWLSNEVGTTPLRIGAATVALHSAGSAIRADRLRSLTFGAHANITIAAGARVLSDPVILPVRNFDELAISLHLPDDLRTSTSPVTYHVRALQTSYIAPGNQTGDADLVNAAPVTAWFFLSGVDVARRQTPVVAAFGDSITDGDQRAAPNEPVDLNARYTDFLAQKLLADRNSDFRAAVINLGISGNQVTATFIGKNGQARFNEDVLTRNGVTHLVLIEGINDITLPGLLTVIGIPTPPIEAATIIAGLRQMAVRGRAAGIKVIGGTLSPSGGSPLPGYSGAEVEAKRQAVNTWIRGSRAFDAVVDFDALLRDPQHPERMRAELTADGLHPNSDGYRLMAAAVARVLDRQSEEHASDH